MENIRNKNLILLKSTSTRRHILKLEEIIFFEKISDKDVRVVCIDKVYTIKTSLKNILVIFENKNFLLTHRSYIVNLIHIKEIQKTFSSYQILFKNCKETAILSRTKIKDLEQYLYSI